MIAGMPSTWNRRFNTMREKESVVGKSGLITRKPQNGVADGQKITKGKDSDASAKYTKR